MELPWWLKKLYSCLKLSFSYAVLSDWGHGSSIVMLFATDKLTNKMVHYRYIYVGGHLGQWTVVVNAPQII
jgi:hypothetical protein